MNAGGATAAPVVRDIVLVGGGHSHALLVRRWAMRPLAGVRLTLVSRDVLTPYSGMLPGLVAGHYGVDEVHIDLLRLCAWAGVRFIRAEMTGLDPERREITLADGTVGRRPPLAWDLLSLDTGSTPDLSVPGAREHATPIKPVSELHARWRAIRDRVVSGRTDDATLDRTPVDDAPADRPLSLGVVGSGAGGFELVMAMRHALPPERADCHWVLRRARPLGERPARLGERALAAARRAGVSVHVGFDVARVRADGVEAADGRFVALDETLWCTAATGPDWPAAAGLATDAQGFVLTDSHLRSVSHPHVFATGDIGTQRRTPSAKAGVFAVRQAPVLFENLRRTLLGRPLASYTPQRDFLSLMATGPRSAIASRGPFVVEGEAVWRWKDRIDRRFMERFATLPPMRPSRLPPLVPDALLAGGDVGGEGDSEGDRGGGAGDARDDQRDDVDRDDRDGGLGASMRCRGCGAKVGERVLDETLAALGIGARDDVLSGVADGGDAAVLDTGNRTLVQSVDQLDAIVDDPWLFGRVAALHALSDVVTEPVRVHSAQVLATLPHAHERVTRRELGQLMHGIVGALDEEGCTLVGGHTAEGATLGVGLVVNALHEGTAADDAEGAAARGTGESGSVRGTRESASAREGCEVSRHGARDATPRDGDALVLTQPLGIGTLFAALARGRARGVDVQVAIEVMSRSNRGAAETLRAHGARVMTDVTGFGLLGHLVRLLRSSPLRARVDVATVPLLGGAFALAEAGLRSSLWPASRHALDAFDGVGHWTPAWHRLLCDPQTGGGLLGVVPAPRAADAVDALHASGYGGAAVVGRLRRAPRHALAPPAACPAAPTAPGEAAASTTRPAGLVPVPHAEHRSLPDA